MKLLPITSLVMYLMFFGTFLMPIVEAAFSTDYIQAQIGLLLLLGVFAAAYWWLVARKIIKISANQITQGRKKINLATISKIRYDLLVIPSERARTELLFLSKSGKKVSINIAGFSQKQIRKLLKRIASINPLLNSSLKQIEEESNFQHSLGKYLGIALLLLLIVYLIYLVVALQTI